MTTKIGFALGVCPVCGKTLRRPRPADVAICDCYVYCPLDGKKMEPYTPDLTPSTYEPNKGLDVVMWHGDTVEILTVNAFVPELIQWVQTGQEPYLHEADDGNYISASINGRTEKYFTFQKTEKTNEKPTRVKVQVYGGNSGTQLSNGVDVYIWDSSAWQFAGQLIWESTGKSWKELDISQIITTKLQVDACRVYFVKQGVDSYGFDLDAAKLEVTWTQTDHAEPYYSKQKPVEVRLK